MKTESDILLNLKVKIQTITASENSLVKKRFMMLALL